MIIFAIFTKTWHTWRVPVPVVTEALFRESRGQSPLSGSGHHPLNIGFLCWRWRWWWCVVVRCVAPLHVAAVAIVTPWPQRPAGRHHGDPRHPRQHGQHGQDNQRWKGSQALGVAVGGGCLHCYTGFIMFHYVIVCCWKPGLEPGIKLLRRR